MSCRKELATHQQNFHPPCSRALLILFVVLLISWWIARFFVCTVYYQFITDIRSDLNTDLNSTDEVKDHGLIEAQTYILS
ncbi:uncharacterized protein BDV14DRAFT_167031 [Aspergillus stella-maris]|uniref:uncharacterized protein n=1 Tax=Aspergillus stella-maris TaxID=1810926 RepID=UPI003CCD1B07